MTAPRPASRTPRATSAPAVLEQLGGVRGLVYSSLPVLVFVPVSTWAGLVPAIVAALAVATGVLVWRLARRESVQPAVSGFIGVAVCAGIAWALGESKGYFLLGIWSSLVWASVFGVSVLLRRPVVGYAMAAFGGRDHRWRRVSRARRLYDLATLTWAVVFAARFVVQRAFYDADETGLLGAARLAMGWPLTALAALVTYVAHRAAQRAIEPFADEAAPGPDAAIPASGDAAPATRDA